MADYIRESRVWIGRPRDAVFAFFADPEHVGRTTPAWLHWRLVAPVPRMAAGAVLDARLRWLGVPLRWRAFIREWDPPFRFVDVQLRGPFCRWEHRHLFTEERGGTLMEDRVTYRLPLGALGRATHAVLVERQLEAVWAYRERRIESLLGPVIRPGD